MRVRSRFAGQLLDALESSGLAREDLTAGLPLDEATLADTRGRISWAALTAMLDRAWRALDENEERMRDVGRAFARAPSTAMLQRLARTVVSVPRLYEITTRWAWPTTFSELPVRYERLSKDRLRFEVAIPEPHAPCVAFFHVLVGISLEAPALLGLPRATLVTSRVTPRTLELVIDLPPSASVVGRLRRALRAAMHSNEALELLDEQRRELTERIEEAQRSTAEIIDLLDRLPDLVIIHRSGVLLWMNRANVKALGYQRADELVGRSLLDLVEPESRELVRNRMRQAITPHARADVPELSEIRLLARDGRVVVVEISPAQHVIFEHQAARLIVGRDVTERARLQQQLLIAERMASIGMLAAGVAHEVNNPLAYVLNNIEIAMRLLAPLGEPTSESRSVLAVALEGVDRIRAIVRDLLALSRVDDVVVGPIDVLAVVESTLTLAGKTISEGAELSFESHAVPLARGNVARLGQVLVNLLANALESMPASSRDTNRLRVVVRPSGTGGVIVEVSDNGLGIPPEHAARMFEPFFTTKAAGSGTGLGLAISHRLVTEMGGWLSFESTPMHGSTFRVTLPAWGHAEARHEPTSPAPRTP